MCERQAADVIAAEESDCFATFVCSSAEFMLLLFIQRPLCFMFTVLLFRAMNILQSADVIAAEDTRTTGSLLKLLGVERTGKLLSHHEHNTRRRMPEIVTAAR